MDNAEILQGMGFELVTGDLWRHDKYGFINVSIENDLKHICTEIFDKGYLTHKAELRKFIGVKENS